MIEFGAFVAGGRDRGRRKVGAELAVSLPLLEDIAKLVQSKKPA